MELRLFLEREEKGSRTMGEYSGTYFESCTIVVEPDAKVEESTLSWRSTKQRRRPSKQRRRPS